MSEEEKKAAYKQWAETQPTRATAPDVKEPEVTGPEKQSAAIAAALAKKQAEDAAKLTQIKTTEAYRQFAESHTPAGMAKIIDTQIQQGFDNLKAAEALSESWGNTIIFGGKSYNLGTTQGYRDYKQALRDTKSQLNTAKNQLKEYGSAVWEYETATAANEVIRRANEVIEEANRIILEQRDNVERIVAMNNKLVDTYWGHIPKPLTEKEAEEKLYKDNFRDTYNWISTLVMQDVVDPDEAKKYIEQVAPSYIATVKGKNQLEEWYKELNERIRDAEKRADWRSNEGKSYLDRYKEGNRPTPEQLAARLEHLSLSATRGFATALPVAVIGAAGGPLVAGLIAGASVAAFTSPQTRWDAAVFIGAHPEEFMASVAGALAAGVSVAKVKQMWGDYKVHLAEKRYQAFTKKMDKLIDDYAYLEQKLGAEFPSKVEKAQLKAQYLRDYPDLFEKLIDDYAYSEQLKGAEFPSRVVQAPGDQPYVATGPLSESAFWEDYLFKNLLSKSSPEEIAAWLKKTRPDFFEVRMVNVATGEIKPTLVKDIISKYPELRDPFLHPAFTDPNILDKSNLVARIPDVFKHPAFMDPNILDKANIVARLDPNNLSVSPLLIAALTIVSQQGYITDAQIKELIDANTKLLEYYRQNGVDITIPWTEADLANIQIPDAAAIVASLPLTTVDVIQATVVDTDIYEPVPVIPVPVIPPTPTPPPEPTPPKEPPPPEKPKDVLWRDKRKPKEDRIPRLHVTGIKGEFQVKFFYPRGGTQTVTVEARSYPEALNRAQRQRRATGEAPYQADIWRTKQ